MKMLINNFDGIDVDIRRAMVRVCEPDHPDSIYERLISFKNYSAKKEYGLPNGLEDLSK